jgi:hypothetical protein
MVVPRARVGLVRDLFVESTRLFGQGAIIGVARRVEHRPDLNIRETVNHARLTNHCVAAALDDFLEHPLEILLSLLIGGKAHRRLS